MINSNVTGTTKIFAHENNGRKNYSTALSKKQQDGTWDYGYINVQFRKGVDISDRQRIEIKNGWLTFYKTRDGKTVPYIFVNEFEFVREELQEAMPDNFSAIQEDVPF